MWDPLRPPSTPSWVCGRIVLALACPCPPMHCSYCWAEKGVYSGWKDTLGFKLSANVSSPPTLRMAARRGRVMMVKQVITLVMVVISLAKAQDLSCPKGSPVKAENFYVIGASGGDCKVDVIHGSSSSLPLSSSLDGAPKTQWKHHKLHDIMIYLNI